MGTLGANAYARVGGLRPPNPEFHARLKRRLRENRAALDRLSDSGLTPATVEHFGLGLSAPYTSRRSSAQQSDALVYPVVDREGGFVNKYGYFNVPGVTANPGDEGGWMTGEPRTYYAEAAAGKRSVFVCEDARDVWLTWQALADARVHADLLPVASTHRSEFPEEWGAARFWADWDEVFLGFEDSERGEALAGRLAVLTGREARRVTVPPERGTTWAEFWRGGEERAAEFGRLLEEAPYVSVSVSAGDGGDHVGPGRFPYRPVNINGAFHNSRLYYTVQVLNRSVDVERREAGEEVVREVERLETVVVRSDRTVHSAVLAPAPKGTRFEDRVLRLTDGTLLDRPPSPNRYATWSWPSIEAYLAGRTAARPLGEILADVLRHLRASVWLPHEEDYALLALTVPVTYAQSVFDSVPIIFMHGPAGSGKSETGRAMARVCANAYVCGQSSAASIARFIDESRGFVVLDDLEAIGNRGGEFTELVQALKLSYNKETAVKVWTDVKTMRTMRLNFFGVKMVNNTRGADEILGSRMLRIQTRAIPEQLKREFREAAPTEAVRLRALQDELHAWAFENVGLIDAKYRALCPKNADRLVEIAAPLRVMAALAGDEELSSMLEAALARQGRKAVDVSDPAKVLREALLNLVASGYETLSVTHLALEMRLLLGQACGRLFDGDMPEWAHPEWVGRRARAEGLLDASPARTKRIRVRGANLRFYPVTHVRLAEAKAPRADGKGAAAKKQPQEFCRTCDGCPYQSVPCELRSRARAG
jgi:hypothetical protein